MEIENFCIDSNLDEQLREQTKEILDMFYFDIPRRIILTLKRDFNRPPTATDLMRKLNITYSHLLKTANRLEEMGFMKFRKSGRTKLMILTEAGFKFGEHLEQTPNRIYESLLINHIAG